MTDTTPKPFDPTEHGFVYLRNYQAAPGVRFYEYRNHQRANGSPDYFRSTVYLSQDGWFYPILLCARSPFPGRSQPQLAWIGA